MIIAKMKCYSQSFCFVLCLGYALPCVAQDLEPRRWSHLPIGINFAAIGYAHTEADIGLNPTLQIEDAELELDTWAAKYIKTFEVLGKSARMDFAQVYNEGLWTGSLRGEQATVKRSGFSDSLLRASINLIGAPPLKGSEYAAYRAETDVETIVGLGLGVQLPTGEYMDDKLINLGTNRYTFRPQVGVLHNRGKWSSELTGSVWIYTDNNNFFNGNKLEQDPLYFFQSHLIYTFRPGFWLGVSAGYYFGGESTVNGVESDDRKENLSWALSLGYPIGRKSSVKFAYIQTRNQEFVGIDTDTFAIAFSSRW
jgi:hypothetical protein